MKDLRALISACLKTLHPRVYFQVAPKTATYPYIVYDLPTVSCDGEGGEIANIEVDGWDCNETGDTTVIENLMSTINVLDKQTLSNDNISVNLFLEQKMALTDEDKRIKRRKYTYSGRIIRR